MFLVDWAVKMRIRPPEFETSICDEKYHVSLPPPLFSSPAAAAVFAGKLVSGQLDVDNPFVLISSGLLVQPDEGVSDLVVDRIGDNLTQSTEKSRIIVITVGARHKCQRASSLAPPSSAASCRDRTCSDQLDGEFPSVLNSRRRPPPPSSPEIRSGQFDEENPSAQNSSVLLVKADEGISYPVVDLIGVIYRSLP
ncbi:hypothetical protein F511_37788 [Dorcoceras hygrometricum]|uniref:Uncharacterized protein n=1 Tax=Dorcoceras hygrometricum TaxID=472368 RepID=A0A2Z7CYW6_9LAMI|nr:hypothetical protein F511_37788 [Dorcoceras hygrometricum]